MFPLGLSSATTVRVSNALGAGLPLGAKRSAHTSACMVLCGQLVLATSIFLSRNWWGYLFTDIQEVRSRRNVNLGLQLRWVHPGDCAACCTASCETCKRHPAVCCLRAFKRSTTPKSNALCVRQRAGRVMKSAAQQPF